MADALQASFASGEVSPSLYGRVDLTRYRTALRTCKNFMTVPQGGAANRPGTVYVGRAKIASKKARLIPFEYNTEQSYCLEMGDLYFRIVKDGGHVLEPSVAINDITQANPGVVTTGASHGFANGDWVYIDADVAGMIEVRTKTYQASAVTATTLAFQDLDGNNVDTTGFGTYISGGTVARLKTVTTPYLEAELPTLKFIQAADVMTVTHGNHAPREITRGGLGHHDFSMSVIAFAPSIAAPTGLGISQDWQVEIKNLVLTAATHIRVDFQAVQDVALNFSVGQRIWIENVGGTVELNGKWFLVSRIAPSSAVFWMYIINTNGSDLDGTAMTPYTSGGNVYTKEKLKYRITSVDDKTGEESLSSADLVLDHANELSKQGIDLSLDPVAGSTPVRTKPVTQYNVYKNKNGIFGYIGSTPGSIKNEDYLTVLAITTATPGVVTTFAAHGFKNGDKVFFTGSLGMTMVNGQTYLAAAVTSLTFELRNFIGTDVVTSGTFTADLKTISDITQDPSGGVVTTSVAHGYSKNDAIYIAVVLGMTEVNDKLFGVGTVLSTTTFVLTDFDGKPIDTSGFSAHVPGGGPHIVKRAMCGPSPFWFHDDDIEAALVDVAPPTEAREPFLIAGNFPGSVAFHEQRRIFARTDNDIQKLWATQPGNIYNMNVRIPSKPDDSIDFTLPARQANEIRHLVSLGELLIFTSGAEWVSSSGDAGYIIENIRNRVQSGNGSADYPAPLVVSSAVLYVQDKGTSVLEMAFSFEANAFASRDRSILSDHLFRGKVVNEWVFANVPLRVVWAVLNDGTLAAMTYLPEQEVWGWHRHDTDGDYESVCAIGEGDEDAVYFIVERSINGSTLRYIERQHTRRFADIRDAFFVDCGLSLDLPLTITAATKADPVEISSAAHGLSEADDVDMSDVVGMTELNLNRYKVANPKTNTLELVEEYNGENKNITGATQANPCVVTAVAHGWANAQAIFITGVAGMTELNGKYYLIANKTDDTYELQDFDSVDVDSTGFGVYTSGGRAEKVTTVDGTAFTTYVSGGKARKAEQSVSGLDHLEAETVSILADASEVEQQVVTNGAITLPGRKASRIHVGLPYTSDLETLDLRDAQGVLTGRLLSVSKVHLRFIDTRGGFVGQDAGSLAEIKQRDREDYNQPTALQEGEFSIVVEPDWLSAGRIMVRQTAPLPMTVQSIGVDVTRSDS